MKNEILKKLKNVKNKKIGIIGDIILDKYIFGDVERISPEAPVPVVRVKEINYKLGASANVAKNIASMGGIPILIGLVGTDNSGQVLNKLLKSNRISPDYLVVKKKYKTIVKERIISLNQQMLRIDYDPNHYNFRILPQILDIIKKENLELLIIEDYNKGLLRKKIMEEIIKYANNNGIITIADPHPTRSYSFYKGTTCITPNLKEAFSLLNLKHRKSNEEIIQRLNKLVKNKYTLLTLGKEGMLLYDGKFNYIPTRAKKVYDVTGAGDTVVALFSLGIISHFSLIESAIFANYGASYVVGQLGTSAPTMEIIEKIMTDELK